MFFIIGTIMEIIVACLCFFLPVVYSLNWKYDATSSFAKYTTSNKITYSLSTVLGASTIILLLLVISIAILYFVLFFLKKVDKIKIFIFPIAYLIPPILMIVAKSRLHKKGNIVGTVYATGTNSGLTGWGWLMIVLTIVSAILVVVGLVRNEDR